MRALTVTARGQVTFRKDVLRHRCIQQWEKIELDLLPEGRGMLKAAQKIGSINSFIWLLAHRTKRVTSLEKINEAAAQAWAGKV